MAVYWPGNFLRFLWTKTKLRSTIVADRGEPPLPPPPCFLDQTEARRAGKKFLDHPHPPPPPSYLRVWLEGLDPLLNKHVK